MSSEGGDIVGQLHLYAIVGRHVPTDRDPKPKNFRMKVFAEDEVRAKSKFWYFIRQFKRIKRMNGEIMACNEIFEKKPLKVKNFGIWMRYNSRTDPINMYKEYRDVTLTGAVAQMYMEVAGRHRGRASGVQIMKTAELSASECKREQTMMYLNSKIKFPLPHRVQRAPSKRLKGSIFKAKRANTFY